MISVTKVSRVSGRFNTMELPISQLAYDIWSKVSPEYRPCVARTFPHLDADQFEFLTTGMTPDELDTMVATHFTYPTY